MSEPNTLPPETHQAVALLPWYLNGTLSAGERTAVSAHLQECPSCRRELDELVILRTQVRQASDAGPFPSTGLAQAILARVREESLRHTGRSPVTSPAPAAPDSIFAQADRWLRSLMTPQWVPTLVTVLLIGQIGLLTWSLTLQHVPRSDSETAGTVTSRGLNASTMHLEIEFEPAATMGQIQRLLESVQARMVTGPTPRGTFILELPGSDADSADARTESLRTRRDVVRSVQTLTR
jgi:hypothetical protein